LRSGPDPFGNLSHLPFVRVPVPWPEKTFQTVFPSSWDHVHMKVGDTLADFVIDCRKSSLRAHAFLDRAAQELCVRKKRPDEGVRQIHQRLVMGPGDEQAMALKKWAAVQESHAEFIFQHDRGRQFARNYSAEFAGVYH
jgi:hypothetical protein